MTYNAGNSQCHTCCSWYIMALNEKAWNMVDDRCFNDALVIYTECFGFSWFLVTRCCWLVVTGALQDALVCTCRFALWLAFPAFQRELYFWIVSQSLIDVISYMSRRTNSSPGDLLLRVTTSPKLWRIATLLLVASAKQGVFFYILFTIKYLNTGFFLPIISNLVGSLWNESSFQSYPSNLLFCFFEHPLYSA